MSFDSYRVVETDMFGGDYPDESFSSPSLRRKDAAEKIADILNEEWGGPHASRFYKVVKMPYALQPGFEP